MKRAFGCLGLIVLAFAGCIFRAYLMSLTGFPLNP
jgi:hypothetical protein